jgi:hypothetical protein
VLALELLGMKGMRDKDKDSGVPLPLRHPKIKEHCC